MTPEERQLLSGLFDRVRNAAGQPRDREAESFIGDAVRAQPYAPYLLAQTVIVQEQALRAANERLQQLEEKVRQLESGQGGAEGGGSFLGGIGRSIFGGGPEPTARPSVPSAGAPPQRDFGGAGPMAGGAGGFGQQGGFAQQGGPWGQSQGAPGQGGGFLKGALGAAAGVAGGVLLANSISGLLRGNPLGITSGVPGFGGGAPGGETVINNYYENDGPSGDYGSDRGGDFQQAADFGPDDGDFGSDGGDFGSDGGDYNV